MTVLKPQSINVSRKVGRALVAADGTVIASDGILADGLFCAGANAYENGLLYGMGDFLAASFSRSNAPLILANARLHAKDLKMRVHILVQQSSDGGLSVDAFDATADGLGSRTAEQKRREQVVFSQMSSGVGQTADKLRRALRAEIDNNPDKPQPAAIQKLWRFEGLAQDFATRAKLATGGGVIDLA